MFTILRDKARLTMSHHIILVNDGFGHKHLLPTEFYFWLMSQNIPTNSKGRRVQICALGSCKVLAWQLFIISNEGV
jgi:hypothetical protein